MYFRSNMVSKLTLVIFVCLTGHIWACCTPDQWEGYQGSQAGYAGFRRRGSMKVTLLFNQDGKENRLFCLLIDESDICFI